jgi:8-oxo-dGTP pyrophosphatase MutT (NUDIX family)
VQAIRDPGPPPAHAIELLERGLPKVIVLPAGRPSAVLVLLYPSEGRLHVTLTRRTEDLAHHKGQIAFPGGSCDAGDRDYWSTALRESREEVGLLGSPRRLGFLPPIFIPVSGFAVAPCVGYLPLPPEFAPQSGEVAALLEPALDDLWPVEAWEDVPLRTGGAVRLPYYPWQGHKIWGATARMLHALRGFLESQD